MKATSNARAFWVSLTVALAQLSCEGEKQPDYAVTVEPLRTPSPTEVSGDVVATVHDVWRRSLGSGVEDVDALASWGDGIHWLGIEDGRLLELDVKSDALAVAREGPPIESGPWTRTLGMSPAPDGSLLAWSTEGVARYLDRKDPGAMVAAFQSGTGLRFAYQIVALPDGGFVVSGGRYPDDPLVPYAIHEYDNQGAHVSSWHPAHEHDDWRVVSAFSGRPVALTADGGVLVSELAPFRITKYPSRGLGEGSVLVEDARIVSEDEFDKALPESDPGSTRFYWDRSRFVDELPDGNVLALVHLYPRRVEPKTLFVLVSPDGRVLGSTLYDETFWVVGKGLRPNRYLTALSDEVGEIEVRWERR